VDDKDVDRLGEQLREMQRFKGRPESRAEKIGRKALNRAAWMVFGIMLYQLATSYGWFGIEC
jgi:hypothetical protein